MNKRDHLWRANDALCLSLWSLIKVLDCKTIKVARRSRTSMDTRPKSELEARAIVQRALSDAIINIQTGTNHLQQAHLISPVLNGHNKLARLNEILALLDRHPSKFRALPSSEIINASASIQNIARDCIWEATSCIYGVSIREI